MGSRKTHEGAEAVYAAAQKWVDCALKADDSLFTPGKPIWSSRWLGELRERFLDRPDVGQGSFYDKLSEQLEGSPPEIYQLMAEVLYIHFLIIWPGTMRGETKVSRINDVLRWSEEGMEVPPGLVAPLTSGIANIGQGRSRYFPFYVGFIAEFVDRWKELEPDERQRLLAEPWEFKAFATTQVELRGRLFREASNAHRPQLEALLHLVHPDTFEGVVSVNDKTRIADTVGFAHCVTEQTTDVDRKLFQIRQGLETELGRNFDFYDEELRTLWQRDERPTANYWIVQAPDDIRDSIEHDRFIGVGFVNDALGDLSHFSKEELRSRVDGVNPNSRSASHATNQLWRFIHEIKQGDYVLVPLIGQPIFNVGQVTGPYTYNPSVPKPHRRSVRWFRTNVSKDVLDSRLGRATVQKADSHRGTIDRLVREGDVDGLDPASHLNELAKELHLPVDFLEEIKSLLKDKKQVIFQGPPGTGKTYVAQALAKHLAGSEERVTLVQLHPSYAYEDFVQGFRPTLNDDGQPGFDLRNGPLLQAAERARDDPTGANHFLVIDEINRGNLAKVLGELYFLLEYRDRKIRLQYQGDEDEEFSLPPNLYFIGTMNTADRSIALVDLALRRRFYFVEFHPDDEPVKSVLRNWLREKAPDTEWVANVVEGANVLLEKDRHAAIGPSYFMKNDLDATAVKRIWKHSVLPYVEEAPLRG